MEKGPTKLELAVCLVVGTYFEHAGEDGKLSKGELKKLFENEMPNLTTEGDKVKLNEMFKDLDMDGSGFIDFPEYMTLVATFCCGTCEIAKCMCEQHKS